MPRVQHSNGAPEHGAPVSSSEPRKSDIFAVLDFFGDEGWKTALDLGRFLGVEHKAQAIQRGSLKLKSMMMDDLVYRGTTIPDKDTTGEHIQYALTERGKTMRSTRRVLAKPTDVQTLAPRRTTA